ncbi:GNAT family N-acetyltransferase [Streptomyces sp. SCL15-6]|uniref:GNAT family N-acetyltransferase n=1 Tax=Streptomyces sp. SCL15-6 TaxID=2967222 RepID=UPI002966AA32|nr:GNAT family N-acetyltransferase [Streptomyces sp. SCL15-6]
MTTHTHPHTGTGTDVSGITIRPVRADELDTFFDLIQLIDLHMPADKLPALKATIAAALNITDGGPFSHGYHHFLFATAPDGTPIASVHVGPARWMINPQIPARIRRTLIDRASNIDTLAVHPDHRGHGIGSRLLTHIETTFRNAGYRALTLRHEQASKRFFTTHGYTSLPRLAVDLAPAGLFTDHDPAWKYAIKPLTPTAAFTRQRGYTTLTGLLD